jgi:integrase
MRGTVFKRSGQKTWRFEIDMPRSEDGRRQRFGRGGFRTKAEAQAACSEALEKLRTKTLVTRTKITVAQYLREEWLPKAQLRVRPSAYESYRTIIDSRVCPHIGGCLLQELTAAQINSLYTILLERGGRTGRGLHWKSVLNTHTVLHRALKDAVRWGHVARNIAELADPPRGGGVPRKEMKTWRPGQLTEFLKGVREHPLYAAWLLTATTGMRRGEVLGARWKDFDSTQARLSIRQTVITINYKIAFSTPKTKKGIRSVALDPATIEALEVHRLEQQLANTADTGLDLIFADGAGGPIHPGVFSATFERLTRDAGLPPIRFHDLRHTYATLALAAGIHPKVVSERLGHANISITLDTYSHAIPAMEADAALKVASLILNT